MPTPIDSIRARRGALPLGPLLALLVLAVVVFLGIRAAGLRADAGPTLEERYRADRRIRLLLEPCATPSVFEQDTSNLALNLTSKLDFGDLDALRRARIDLAAMDAGVEAELRRLYDEASRDPNRVAVVRNILEVIALAEEPWGHEIARLGVTSSRSDVRTQSAYYFRKHGAPEDYDLVHDAFRLTNQRKALASFGQALKVCDRDRFAEQAFVWLDRARGPSGRIEADTFVDFLAPELTYVTDPEIVRRLVEASEGLLPRHRAYLIAPAARAGDAAALNELRSLAGDAGVSVRQNAIQAMGSVGLRREALPALANDSDGRLRAIAAGIVAGAEPDEEIDAFLREALVDPDNEVRRIALEALVERGDDTAWAQALRLLEGNVQERSTAMRALRDRWDARPGASERARERLLAQWAERGGVAAGDGQIAEILGALGSVAGRETGEALLAIVEELGDRRIQRMSAHRWIVGQVYNAGPDSRAVLRDSLRTEEEPMRRLDLISFVWQDDAPEAFDLLLEVFEDETRSPYERLYVADRLVRMGRPEVVAPVMKATYLASVDPVLRPGLQCMLWTWYGVIDRP